MKFQENRWFGENWWLEGWKEVSLDELRFGFEKRNRPWPDIHHALVTDEASQVRYFPHCCLARSFLKKNNRIDPTRYHWAKVQDRLKFELSAQ